MNRDNSNFLGMSCGLWLRLFTKLDGPHCDTPCPICQCFTPSQDGKYGKPCKVCEAKEERQTMLTTLERRELLTVATLFASITLLVMAILYSPV